MEVQQRERDMPVGIGAMQVQQGESPVAMHVQVRERDKQEKLGNGIAYEVIDSRSGEEEENEVASDSKRSSNNLFGNTKLAAEFFANNSTKAFLIVAFCLSVLLVILLSRQDSASSLCNDSHSAEILFPDVNFDRVKRVKDKGRHAAVSAENWIVVSVLGPPTDEIRGMSKLQGWQILAVGDSETPNDWAVPGVIFLSTELQATFGFRITALLPYNSYVRKSIGYLFAIQHGARTIYDGDTHASLLGGHLGKDFDMELIAHKKSILQYRPSSNRTVVNPFIHYGQRSVWPRGLPVTSVPKISADIFYYEVPSGNQYIQQGLANGLPDIDSLFYRTRRLAGEAINIDFDRLAPPVSLPQGTMAPINSLNTLFHSPAFWAMMLPVSVNTGISDIIRGYWAQRLLWEIGGMVAFYPPSVHRLDRLEGSPFDDEDDMLQDWELLTSFLISWRSSKTSLFDKILDLSYSMAKHNFWSGQDIDFTTAWLQDLVSVGYTPPKLQAFELDDPKRGLPGKSKQFTPQIFRAVYPGVRDGATVEKEMGHLIRWQKFLDNIVLILECEWPLHNSVLTWRMLYGRVFKQVVVISSHAEPSLLVEDGAGWQTYKALPGIFDRFPEAEGYLYLKEDVVLNYWNLLGADKSKLWTLHGVKPAWEMINFNDTGSNWYLKSSVKRTVKSTLYNMPSKLSITYRKSMDDKYFVHSSSNAFYIPQRFVGDFKDLASLGIQYKLAHELAIPLFLAAMDVPENFDRKAFAKVEYVVDGAAAVAAYSADLHLMFPLKVANESHLFHILKLMSTGDHLLLSVL